MSCNRSTARQQHPTRFRRGVQAVRERGDRVRERLTPQRLHAPSLDWLNFLIADVRGGLGPYVVVFLVAEQGWTPTAAGLVSTVGGWLGLAAQVPIGAWLDRTRHKRGAMLWGLLGLSIGAVVIAIAPSFWPVLLANGAMQVVSGVFEPAVAALTVGLCTREVLTARMGRNAAWSRAGNMAAAILSGLVAWLFSAGAVFLQVPVIAALTAIAAMTIPYSKVDLRRARGLEPGDAEADGPQSWTSVLRSRPLLVFAACSFLYELADAPLLTLVGQKLGTDRPGSGSRADLGADRRRPAWHARGVHSGGQARRRAGPSPADGGRTCAAAGAGGADRAVTAHRPGWSPCRRSAASAQGCSPP